MRRGAHIILMLNSLGLNTPAKRVVFFILAIVVALGVSTIL